MKTWSFRDRTTGAFTGRTYSGPAEALGINTPEGCEAIEGEHAAPPVLADARATARRDAMEQIAALEAQQARPLREMLLALSSGSDNPVAATRVAMIDAEIAELRKILQEEGV